MLPTLERHSVSQINSFVEYRTEWALQRIFKASKFKESVDTARGKAIEEGINFWLDGLNNVKDGNDEPAGSKNPDKCAEYALKLFNNFVEEVQSDKKIDYAQSIYPAVLEAIDSFGKRYKVKELVKQVKVEGKLPGCKKPILGYLDYMQPGVLIIDNKVKAKTPSTLPQGYIIQGGVYNFLTGLPVTFHFEIPLKGGPKIVELPCTKEECAYGLKMAIEACQAIEKIFDGIEGGLFDFDMLKALFFPNIGSVYGEDKSKEIADFFFA